MARSLHTEISRLKDISWCLPEALKKVNNLLSFYSCPKAQTVSQQTILTGVPALCEDIYSNCHQNWGSSWQDSPSPPVLRVCACMELHTGLEKSQRSC